MREIGRARRGACGWHAVHVTAEVGGCCAAVMARAIFGRRLFNSMIAVSGVVIVVFTLKERFDLRGMHGRFCHRNHTGL